MYPTNRKLLIEVLKDPLCLHQVYSEIYSGANDQNENYLSICQYLQRVIIDNERLSFQKNLSLQVKHIKLIALEIYQVKRHQIQA